MSLWETKLAKKGLTFDDVLLIPAESHVLPNEVKLDTKFNFIFHSFPQEWIPLPKETWQLPWPKMVA